MLQFILLPYLFYIPGVGKLFVWRAKFLKIVPGEGRTVSLQSRKIYSVRK